MLPPALSQSTAGAYRRGELVFSIPVGENGHAGDVRIHAEEEKIEGVDVRIDAVDVSNNGSDL